MQHFKPVISNDASLSGNSLSISVCNGNHFANFHSAFVWSLSVFKNLLTTDPLALHLVIDDLEERVGKLEAVAENHQYEQRKVSM